MKKKILFMILFWTVFFTTQAQVSGTYQSQESDFQLLQNNQYTDIQVVTTPSNQKYIKPTSIA